MNKSLRCGPISVSPAAARQLAVAATPQRPSFSRLPTVDLARSSYCADEHQVAGHGLLMALAGATQDKSTRYPGLRNLPEEFLFFGPGLPACC
jgi:hypothetical protein